MGTRTTNYEAQLLAPIPQYPGHGPGGHAVQFYKDDSVLLESLTRFIAPALLAGNAALIIATQKHRDGLARRLAAQGLNIHGLTERGRYIALDAAETLSKFCADQALDAALFKELIGRKLLQARAASESEQPTVVAFGEMVALLWADQRSEAAIQLEQLWNELVDTHSFSLYCAYPMDTFSHHEDSKPFERICASHSLVIPDDSYTTLNNDQERLRNIASLQQKELAHQSDVRSRKRLVDDLSATRNADEVLSIILRNAIALIGAEGGIAGLRGPQGLFCTKYFQNGETLPVQYCFPEGHGLPGRLLVNKIPSLSNDMMSDPQVRHELYERYGVRCALSAPILDERGEVAAFFEIHNKIGGSGFNAEDQRLLSLITPIATIAVQKALDHTREIALRQTEERFRHLVEAAQDYAIFMLDATGRVTSWNSGAERIKGYKASEIIGQHFSCFYPAEDLQADKPRHELETAASEGRLEDEGWRVRKDGSKFWANVIITPIRDDAGSLLGFSKVTRDFTERMLVLKALRKSRQELHDSESSLRKLSLHLLRTQEEERRRIGRDLHDSLGQYLSLLKMKLDSFASLNQPPEARSGINEITECANLAEQCIKEVRTISYLLYPPMLEEMGLKSAISWYLDGFTKRSGITATLDISPEFGRLPADAETAFFRVLQESLTNIHRHSGSETAHVRLFDKDGTTVLEVSDQGKGILARDSEEFVENGGHSLGVGVRGMTERMRQLGGDLELVSSSNGTTVIASVPRKVISMMAAAQNA